MLKYIAALAGWLLTGSICIAQEKDSLPTRKLLGLPNEWMIKFAPFSILETDGGINFSGEYLVSNRKMGFQLEAQAVLFDLSGGKDLEGYDMPVNVLQTGPPHGIKLRPEVRYYLQGIELSKRPPRPRSRLYGLAPEDRRRLQNRTYIAVDFLYKYILRQRINEFAIFNSTTQPVFKQRAVYTDVKQVTGFDFKLGAVGPGAGKHLLSDFYIGIGIRYKKFWYRNLPAGGSAPERTPSFVGNPGNTFQKSFVSFPFGLKVTYRL